MLSPPTMEQLQALKLTAMATAWTTQQQDAPVQGLGFDERFGLLVEAEWLARRHGPVRLEAACARALAAGARSYRHVDAILKHGLDRCPLPPVGSTPPPLLHDQVRGPAYYQ